MPSKKIIASKSIEIVFNPPSRENNGEFKITGRRPTSALKHGNYSPQGNHVTAYNLIEFGLIRILNNLSFDEVNCLLKLENRESLRKRRKKLYDYVSAIAIVDSTRADDLYKAFDEIIREYNTKRIKKTLIRQEIETQKNTFDEKIYHLVLDSIGIKYNENGKSMMETFKKISATILTFYNKIKNTSFHEIEGYKPLADEGAHIKELKYILPELVVWSKRANEQGVNSPEYAVKTPLIVNSMLKLIHYPEIDDQAALEEHRKYNITCHGDLTRARDNTEATLIEVLARHIHIFFSVYPEIKECFPQEIIIVVVDNFINKFLGENWPSFANHEVQKNKIIEGVKNNLNEYQTRLKNECYEMSKVGDLHSSDDEDNSIFIRAKSTSSKQALKDTLMQFRLSQLTIPSAWKNSNFPTYNDRPRLSSSTNRLRCYSR